MDEAMPELGEIAVDVTYQGNTYALTWYVPHTDTCMYMGHYKIDNLLHVAVDVWHRFLEEGTDICTVFFDYRKAFDSIPHS